MFVLKKNFKILIYIYKLKLVLFGKKLKYNCLDKLLWGCFMCLVFNSYRKIW